MVFPYIYFISSPVYRSCTLRTPLPRRLEGYLSATAYENQHFYSNWVLDDGVDGGRTPELAVLARRDLNSHILISLPFVQYLETNKMKLW